MKSLRILYIDDDSAEFTALANAFKKYVSLNEDFEPITDKGIVRYQIDQNTIFCVKNSANAIKLIQDICFDLAFIDFKLSGEEGDEVGKHTYKFHYEIHQKTIYQIMLTAYQDKLINTLRAGVFRDFISKPLNDNTAFAGILARYEAFKEEEMKRIEAEKRAEKAEAKLIEQNSIITDLQKDFNIDISSYTDNSSPLKGNSEKMMNIRWFIDVYAATDIPVLLLGETGTGKELVANEIHKRSSRKNRILITINCGAIPETLIESELFGYKKGSHSEAKQDKEGAFKTVGKGTLFLDEFADLSINAQVKVLRAIAEKKFKPVGADKDEDFEGRVICATSQDFKELIGNKNFRSDLLNRVNSLFPKIPSLFERKEDIYDIVFLHLTKKFGKESNLPVTPDGIAALRDCDYNWPGNVRELLFFIDNILTVFPKTKIDKEKVLKLLSLWKTHQADIGLLNDQFTKVKIPSPIVPKESSAGRLKITDLTPKEKEMIISVKSELVAIEGVYSSLLTTFEKNVSLSYNVTAPTIQDVSCQLKDNDGKPRGKTYLTQRYSKSDSTTKSRNRVASYLLDNELFKFKIKDLPPFNK